MTEDEIRRDERHKIAALLETHADTLTTFTGDDSNTIRLVVFMLRLDGADPDPLPSVTGGAADNGDNQ